MNSRYTYLIWSIEHEAWWKSNKNGYTRRLKEAGRYPPSEASAIVTGANFGGNLNECMIPFGCLGDEDW